MNILSFSVTYFLFTLITLFAAFLLAWQHWQKSLSFQARRLLTVFAVLGLLKVMQVFGASLFAIDATNFEYALQTMSMGVLAWGFSPYLRQKKGIANIFLSFVFVATIVILFLPITSTTLSTILLGFSVIIGVGLFLSMLPKFAEYTFAAMAALVLSLGTFAQLMGGDVFSALRLSEMVAYLLLVIAVHTDFIDAIDLQSQTLLNLSESSQEQIEGLVSMFEATRGIVSSLDLTDVLNNAVKAMVDALNIDQSAVALFEDDESALLKMMATHNPSRKGHGDAVTFPVREQPVLKYALERLQQVEVNKNYENPQIQFLFAMMGSSTEVGPMVVQPLVLDDKAIGVLILGNAQSKQPFRGIELSLIKTMGAQVASAIDNARTYQSVVKKSQKLAYTLRNQEKETGHRTTALEAELKKHRQENGLMSQQLHEQESLARKSQKDLTLYQQQIQSLTHQLKLAQNKVEKITNRHLQLSSEAQSQKKQLAKLEEARAEIQRLKEQVQSLEMNSVASKELEDALETANRRSRKLAHALKVSRIKLQQQSTMPDTSTLDESQQWDNFSWGVLVSNAKGKITRANSASNNLLKISGGKVEGKTLRSLIPDEAWHNAIDDVAQGKTPMLSISFNYNDQMLKATLSPMTDPDSNAVVGTVVLLYDATEEFETQQARDEFVASLAQELRTPMTSIIGYVDLLLSESVGGIGDMQRKFLQRVKANVERMDGLLNDLIGIAAIDSGQMDISPAPINMAEVIEGAIVNAKSQIQEKEILLRLDLPEQMPIVEADAGAMQQVMLNLLNNAIKCSTVASTVTVEAIITNSNLATTNVLDEEQWLRISVADSGGGIAEQDLDRVFDRFYKTDSPLIQGLGETGVGLSIVKHLVKLHGGEVWFETEMGRGTTFFFALPITEIVNDPWEEVDIPPLDLNPRD